MKPGIAVKTLSDVEVNYWASNQHEFNGVSQLKKLFGMTRQENIPARFAYLSNRGIESISSGLLTWYDAREMHPSRTEYRLYYTTDMPLRKACRGDTLLISVDEADQVNVFIIARGTQLAAFLVSQLGGEIGSEYSILTDSQSIAAIEGAISDQ